MASRPIQRTAEPQMLVSSTGLPQKSEGYAARVDQGTLLGNQFTISNDNGVEISAANFGTKAILRSYWMHLRPQLREGLLNQTNVVLHEDEWEEEEFFASLDSYQTMIRALVNLQPATRPYLAVSAKGNFIAAWKCTLGKVVFEMLPMDRLNWSVTTLSHGNRDRASGQTNIEQLRDIVVTHKGRSIIDG